MSNSVLPRDGDNFENWWNQLRPTCRTHGIDEEKLPLRVLDVEHFINNNDNNDSGIKFIKPNSWETFVVISHTWKQNIIEWFGPKRPWPANNKRMRIWAFSKEDLLITAKILLSLDVKYCWIDNICIDQDSLLEKKREINRMGTYYSMPKTCYIFTRGIGSIGGPGGPEDTHLPRWYSRVWTLQEIALAKNPEHIYIVTKDELDLMSKYNIGGIHLVSLKEMPGNLNVVRITHQSVESFIVANFNVTSAADIPEGTFKNDFLKTSFLWRDIKWSKLEILRLVGVRDSYYDEDKIYGVLYLLDIPSVSIRYGGGLRDAIVAVAEAIHVDQLLLLAAVEWATGEWIDGFCAVPKMEVGLQAWGMDVSKIAGQATFLGHRGMEITSLLSSFVRIEQKHGLGNLVVIGNSFGHTSVTTKLYLENLVIGHGIISDVHNFNSSAQFIMIGKSVDNIKFHVVAVIGQQAGNVLRKTGLCIVDSSVLEWNIGRVVLA